MNLSLCPFLTLKSPKGPGGCGKWEARSLLNSCVIEFPHNTANVCMDAGTSVPRAQRVKRGAKIPRTRLVLKQQLIWINLREEARNDELPFSIRSRKSAHGWEKYTLTLNTTILMSQHWGHNYFHNKHKSTITGLSRCPFSRFFPLVAIHICRPCARLPGGPPCWTQGVGLKPKMGIYQPTSALPEKNASVGQDCVVLVTCGGDSTLRRGGGGTSTERKDIYSLSFNRAVRGSSFFAQGQVYLCWKETQKHISYSSGNDKHPSTELQILGKPLQKRLKDLFSCLCSMWKVTWAMCHHKEILERFCWRQAYLVLCLCTKWLIGLWINMICFQEFDSEYPDYANLPSSWGRGKLKKWQSFSLV